ncbi:Beta-ketoacyl synthase [Methylobacterium sp. 4-46]|uniref:type I polyketide synthase n=1 Tax=unclassified Methylobacterium TaxID=2615210 RepID=UPI000165C80B|nr:MULTISPECIES: type I polyketide synthase [Methylobacterium]ACA14749.1 Beta-ketoacyl synthase [Methylobacterium sp. 4-46]WFT80501.1 type I polyketide synthase [Methylobacterium nodulans]
MNEPIAIVGMACRFPGGAGDPASYWNLLKEGRDAVVEVPKERWDAAEIYDEDPSGLGKTYAKWGGFLQEPIDRFDAGFFNIPPDEARFLDPQQRLLLEVSWEAIENAGEDPTRLRGSRAGVFVGISYPEYLHLQLNPHAIQEGGLYVGLGGVFSAAAGRVSYVLGLQGPSVAIDTACSSSLVAIHQACLALRSRECEMALAGGVNLILTPHFTDMLSKMRALAKDGRCKTFDAAADGYVRSEGCGVLVLRRLADALARQDRIVAVVRGSAVNQDGASQGLTVPNALAQEALIRQALEAASLRPADIDYVEAHGTGTPVGDAIEARALGAVFSGSRAEPLTIGSVKTNLGHLESAAGVASVMKVALALQNELIPRNLNLATLNPSLALDRIPAQVPAQPLAWRRGERRRAAGISGFALQGTNAHVVLEEAPEAVLPEPPEADRPLHLLALSAKSEGALRDLARRYLAMRWAPSLADICHTANLGRAHFDLRMAVTGASVDDVRGRLRTLVESDFETVPAGVTIPVQPAPARATGVVFLFSGGGAQYPGMGRRLYATQPTFRRALDRCAEIVSAYREVPLLSVMFGDRTDLLDRMDYMQPALFAYEWAMTALWRSFGIEPAAVMGHSLGEYAAAAVAEVFSLEDALRLICRRGLLMHEVERSQGEGAMASLAVGERAASEALSTVAGRVSIAALNGPQNTVVSGERAAVRRLVEEFQGRGIKAKLLAVSNASHSPLMEPILEAFEEVADLVAYGRPSLQLISNLTGGEASAEIVCDSGYWTRHIRQPVRFHDGMQTLRRLGYTRFLEVGPHPVLLGMGQDCFPEVDDDTAWLPSARRDADEWEEMLASLGALYVRGHDVDFQGFDRDYPHRRKLSLPTYPFDRKSYWNDVSSGSRAAPAGDRETGAHPWIGKTLASASRPGEVTCEAEIDTTRFAFLADHAVLGRIVFPAAGFLELVAEAVTVRWGKGAACVLRDVHFATPLVLDPAKRYRLQCVLTAGPAPGVEAEFAVLGCEGELTAPWTSHASGRIEILGAEPAAAAAAPDALRARCPEVLTADHCFATFAAQGIAYGPGFRGVTRVLRGRREALGEVVWPEELAAGPRPAYILHPAILDACIQVLSQCVDGAKDGDAARVGLPVQIDSVAWTGTLPAGRLLSHAVLREQSETRYSGDVTILDADGRTIASVQGLTVSLVAQGQLRRMLGRSLHGLQHEVTWVPQEAARPASTPSSGQTWLVFADRGGVAESLRARCEGAGITLVEVAHACTALSAASGDLDADACASVVRERLGAGALAFDKVVFLWGLDESFSCNPTPDALAADQRLGYASLLAVAQELVRTGRERPLYVVTRGVYADAPGAAPALSQAPLWGLAKVIQIEHPALDCVAIDLGEDPSPLFDEIASDARDDRQVRYAGGTRLVARLTAKAAGATAPAADIDAAKTYLIAGAFGGLGVETARWLIAEKVVRSLVLVGRRAPSPAVSQEIEAWRAQGVQVLVRMTDLANLGEVEELFAELDSGAIPPLGGVIHAAGSLRDAALADQTWDDYADLLPAKVFGAWNLHRASLRLRQPLGLMVLFSSASSLFGFAGQSNYAAVNAFLDALAHHRSGLGLRTIGINWGVWARIGRVADLAEGSLREAGIIALDPEEGMALLEAILRDGGARQVGALAVDWPRFLRTLHGEAGVPRFLEAYGRTPARGAQPKGDVVQRVLGLPASERRTVLAQVVQAEVAQILGRGRDESLDPRIGFSELGMDSLMTVQLRNRLKKQFGEHARIAASLAFDHPNIEALSEYLDAELARRGAPAAPAAAPAEPARAAAPDEDAVAIVGLGCRFPGGASDPQAYWSLLSEQRCGIVPVPRERWDNDAVYDPDPDAEGRTYARTGGFLQEPVDSFDAGFFRIVPGEARLLDPQQRLMLEVTWEALEDGGIVPTELRGTSTGVFVGLSYSDYALLVQRAGVTGGGLYAGTGSSASFAAGRISHFLGLQGPCLTLDTACSSSLVALHQAAQSLRRGECTLAVAGGVNLMLAPDNTILLSRARALSRAGQCRAFDEAADGFVRGEGCGVVILKRVRDALANGDRIYAVIRGSAVNHDGASSGLTVPNGSAQEALIRNALRVAGVQPNEVDYVEAHGTGTPLGDPIEVRALGAALGGDRSRPLLLGSVKTNLGHLEAAAGIASIIKVALSLDNELLVPQLPVERVNPNIALDEIPAQVLVAPLAWKRDDAPETGTAKRRIAGVSGFALQGTNVHVVLEEGPAATARERTAAGEAEPPAGAACLLGVSAQSGAALRQQAARYAEALDRAEAGSLLDFCWSANTGRAQFPWRAAVVARTREEMSRKLVALAAGEPAPPAEPKRIAFLFTGQGSQYLGMGRQLYQTFPVFRDALDRCAALLRRERSVDLLDVMWGGGPDGGEERLHQTEYTQAALFSLQYGLVELWKSCGVSPAAVLGHSVGEFAAAVTAGVLGWEDGLLLIADRGRLMQRGTEPGAMVAIAAPSDAVHEVVARHAGRVGVAAVNGPRSIVVSGEAADVREVARHFEAQGVPVKPLQVTRAFHSPLMDPILQPFEARASEVAFARPQIRFVSSLTGAEATDEIRTARYWTDQLRQPVLFGAGAQALVRDSQEWHVVEIGPRPTLLALAQDCVPDPARHLWTPTMGSKRPGAADERETEDASFLHALGQAYASGAPVRWRGVDFGAAPRRVRVPTYPFQRKRFWIETRPGRRDPAPSGTVAAARPLLGTRLESPVLSDKAVHEVELAAESFDFVRDHVVASAATGPVFPAAGFIEMMLEAGREASPATPVGLEAVAFENPAMLRPGESHRLQCVVSPRAAGDRTSGEIEIHFKDGPWTRCATGRFGPGAAARADAVDIEDVRRRCRSAPSADLYAVFDRMGLRYGPALRRIEGLWKGDGEALARIRGPGSDAVGEATPRFVLDPAVLDCGMQSFASCLPEGVLGETLILPVRIGALRCFGALGDARAVWSYARLVSQSGTGRRSYTGDVWILDDAGAVLAEIRGLTVMEASLGTARDLTYGVRWERTPAAAQALLGGTTLVYAEDGADQARRIVEGRLGPRAAGWHVAQSLAEARSLVADQGVRSVVFVAGDAPLLDPRRGYGPCLELIRALSRAQGSRAGAAERPRLLVVTRNAQGTGLEAAPLSVSQAPLIGLARVARLECPEIAVRLIDVEAGSAEWVEEVLADPAESEVAIRGGVRYVPRLTRLADLGTAPDRPLCDPGKSYLVTGGLGALGLDVAQWLAEQEGARTLVLIGRSDPGPEVRDRIDALRSRTGARIETVALDVADADGLRDWLTRHVRTRTLGGIVHAAGTLADATLERQDWDKFEAVARPKVLGAWNLHAATQDLAVPLDFFACFSSAASLLGNAGQANYAAANAFLDLLMHERARLGMPGLSVNWGNWDGKGLAAALRGDHGPAGAGAAGRTLMDSGLALRVFGRLLRGRVAQAGAFDIRWAEILKGSQRVNAGTFLAEFNEAEADVPDTSSAAPRTLADIVAESALAERAEAVGRFLQEELSEVLGARVDPRAGLVEQGMDSLAAVEFRNRLKGRVGYAVAIPPTVIFDYPTLDALAAYLLARFEDQEPRRGADEPRPAVRALPEAGLGGPGLADDEVEDELRALIEAELKVLEGTGADAAEELS